MAQVVIEASSSSPSARAITTDEERIDALTQKIAETDCDRYEAMLPFRFLRVLRRLSVATPDAAARDTFARGSRWLDAISSAGLRRAMQQPRWDLWVRTAERLLALGIVSRYPQAHPARLKQELDALGLSWATAMPTGARGSLEFVGPSPISLEFGTMVLVPPEQAKVGLLHWHRENGKLQLRAPQERVIAVLSIDSPDEGETREAWQLIRRPRVHGVVLAASGHGHTRPGELDDEFATLRTFVQSAWEAGQALGESPLGRIRVVETTDEVQPWAAGQAWVQRGGTGSDMAGTIAVVADLVERAIEVGAYAIPRRLSPQARADFVRRSASDLLEDARTGGEATREWISAMATPADLLADPPAAPLPPVTTEVDTRRRLSLHAVSGLASLTDAIGTQPGLHKTRNDELGVSDWSLLDRMAHSDRESLHHALQAVGSLDPSREEAAFARAALCYVLGEFEDAAEALRACLRIDPDVQEYHHLLSFCARHLGDLESFNETIFGGSPPPPPASDDDRRAPAPPTPGAEQQAPARGGGYEFTGFLGDLVALRDSDRHLSQYIALIAGVRRSLDDWVAADRFEAFERRLATQGLVVRPDCVFIPLAKGASPEGSEYVPTTHAAAVPFARHETYPAGARVHVLVAASAQHADEGLACGWYPVAVGGRVVLKPTIDNSRLGKAFGYPECCVDFFMQHNDWPRKNTIAEALRCSQHVRWQTNCLAKSTPWMILFHMPCAFDCPSTVAMSDAIVETLADFDQNYARRIRGELSQVVLSVNERVALALRDAQFHDKSRATYREALELRPFSLRDTEARHRELLARGDEVRIDAGRIVVLKHGRYMGTIETRCDMGVAEVPVLLDFR